MTWNRTRRVGGAVVGLLAMFVVSRSLLQDNAVAQGQAKAPTFQVDPLWPKPLPNHWVLGSVTGVAIDAQNHVWITHRGSDSLGNNEKGVMLTPPSSSICCIAAPPILEFDQAGTLVSHWGGKGDGFEWPQNPAGITVDGKGHVWIAGAGMPPAPAGRGRGTSTTEAGATSGSAGGVTTPQTTPTSGRSATPAAPPAAQDAHVLKFSRTGTFILQIGKAGQVEGNDSKTTLNRPAGLAVDAATNEVYVADGFGNRRIAVFDAVTGAYKRHWGAYGEKPGDIASGAYEPGGPPAKQFHDVSCVEISKDGLVYVCDRRNNRIQVFQKDGKFVKEAFVSKSTLGATVTSPTGVHDSYGAVWDLAFSADPQQRFIFVADGHDKKVLMLQRDTLTQVGSFGDGGRSPGRFLSIGSVAVDSKGIVYTGENFEGKRVQKWVPAGR